MLSEDRDSASATFAVGYSYLIGDGRNRNELRIPLRIPRVNSWQSGLIGRNMHIGRKYI